MAAAAAEAAPGRTGPSAAAPVAVVVPAATPGTGAMAERAVMPPTVSTGPAAPRATAALPVPQVMAVVVETVRPRTRVAGMAERGVIRVHR